MTQAIWYEMRDTAIRVEKSSIGDYDLSVFRIRGQWHWLVRHGGLDSAEGVALSAEAAKEAAETVAIKGS